LFITEQILFLFSDIYFKETGDEKYVVCKPDEINKNETEGI